MPISPGVNRSEFRNTIYMIALILLVTDLVNNFE